MKPEALKNPYVKGNPTIHIADRVFFVPERMEDYRSFAFPGWKDVAIFGTDQPVKIEFCSGNGTWIARRAQLDPQSNWVAVEKKFIRARKIWAKIKNQTLPNLFVICGEAHTVSTHYFLPNSVSEVFINFPDPWPKRRHAYLRLVKEPFVKELARILKPNGLLTLVTDDPDYSQQMIHELHKEASFTACYPDPFYITNYPDYGSSSFDELWRSQGKAIRYHLFKKS